MATYVGTVDGSADASGLTVATSSGIAVNAGDVLLVVTKYEGGTDPGSDGCTVTDNASGGSNAYTQRAYERHSSDNIAIHIHGAIAKASETLTVTSTLSQTNPYKLIAVMVGRPATGKPFAYDNQASSEFLGGTYTPPATKSTGSFAVYGAGGFAVAAVAPYDAATKTAGSGWTMGYNPETGTLFTAVEYRVLNGESSIEGDFSINTLAPSIVIAAVAYKELSTVVFRTVTARRV